MTGLLFHFGEDGATPRSILMQGTYEAGKAVRGWECRTGQSAFPIYFTRPQGAEQRSLQSNSRTSTGYDLFFPVNQSRQYMPPVSLKLLVAAFRREGLTSTAYVSSVQDNVASSSNDRSTLIFRYFLINLFHNKIRVDVECQRPRRVRIALQGAPHPDPDYGGRHHETNSIRSIRSSCSSRPNTSAFSARGFLYECTAECTTDE